MPSSLIPRCPPFLQEAVDHAERLAELLRVLEPRAARHGASTWLVGRVEEVACFVEELLDEWRCGGVSAVDAASALNAYIRFLHRGIATNFGELAPSCCVSSLIITASPASFLEVTAQFPASLRREDASTTVVEVDDSEIIEVMSAP